jgi:hypothetical protein
VVTVDDLAGRLRSAESRSRELEAQAARLMADVRSDGWQSRLVEAHVDDQGLVEALDYSGERSVDSVTLQGEIMLALIGSGVAGGAGSGAGTGSHARAQSIAALAEALLADEPREAVRRNERGTASVTAREGIVVRVSFDHRVLRGARSQTLCDEVVPLAREAALASDSIGRFGVGTR